MNQNAVVLEISSDEDYDWKDIVDDIDDDHNWLTEVLDEVDKEKYRGDEVVVVNNCEKSGKKLKLNLKSCVDVMNDDSDDDCVILENDPNESVDVSISNDNRRKDGGDNHDSDEIVFVSEKGKVACRDYPHSRHLCIKFPFSTTPNQSHCEQCYCYVCDSRAPCIYWGKGSAATDHCHATDKDELWRHKRKTAKNGTKPMQPVHKVAESLLLNQLHPVHRDRPASAPAPAPAPALVQQLNHTSANTWARNIIRKNRNHLIASGYKSQPDLASHHKTNVARTNTNFDLRTQIQGHMLKKNRLARCRTSYVNPSGQPNDGLKEMLSDLIQSRVNSNPVYQQSYMAPPLPPRSQVASSQSSSMVPAKQSYPVNSLNRLLPVPNSSNRTQPQRQRPVTNPGFKEKRLHSATAQGPVTNEATNEVNSATKQSSVTNDLTNESLLEVGPDELTNYDWIFDNQPVVEQGFTDLHGVYGLNDFSPDSGFMDAGPIFDF